METIGQLAADFCIRTIKQPNQKKNDMSVQNVLWGLRQCKLAFLDSVSKVDGSISGKSLRKTGSRNSMKGTMMKTMKGTRRNRSAQVLSSCE